ncbi:hypothetical protein ACLOJK_016953 [Asimina triloba]
MMDWHAGYESDLGNSLYPRDEGQQAEKLRSQKPSVQEKRSCTDDNLAAACEKDRSIPNLLVSTIRTEKKTDRIGSGARHRLSFQSNHRCLLSAFHMSESGQFNKKKNSSNDGTENSSNNHIEIAMNLCSANLRSANQCPFATHLSIPSIENDGDEEESWEFVVVVVFSSQQLQQAVACEVGMQYLGCIRLLLATALGFCVALKLFHLLMSMMLMTGSDDHQPSPKSQPSSGNTNSNNASTHHIIQDARTYRANLVAWERLEQLGTGSPAQYAVPSVFCNLLSPKWAHPISMMEAGCILVATEKLDGVSTFERSVVLVLGTGNKDSGDGPFGVLINCPGPKKIKDTKLSAPYLATHFADCHLNFGGPLDGSMMLLRTSDHKPPPSFEEVTAGLCFGGRNSSSEAVKLLRSGILKPQDFSFFVGYAGWHLNQLRDEIESGYWYIAACSINLVVGASPDSSSTLWEEVLQLMGGHYSELSRKPKPDSS